ncbi:Ulp1 peptidase [Malassezia nana]|uniref:Ulp1 peptidase n=1 Tax=Malassezia nana TaxID=180528 RepID=A0AAF0EKE8_9BASI|nr:Ulp1 peptidase [Malassezia nana]
MTEKEASSLIQCINSSDCRTWSFEQLTSDQRTGPMKKPTPIIVGERHRLQQKQAKISPIDTPEDKPSFTDTLGPRTRSRTHSESKSTSSAGNAPILRYPSTGPFAVTLLQADLNRLQENEYLNDTLIEFGLRFCQEQIKSRDPPLAQQIYVFNTFFYQKLTEHRDRSKSYEHVRKWTNRVNIFEKKYIVVPIHENMHWYLAIVVNPHMILKRRDPLRSLGSGFQRRRSTRRSADEAVVQIQSDSDSTQDPIALVEEDSKKTTASSTNADVGETESTFAFVLDSLGAHHGPVKTALRDYLRLEARAKGFVPSDVDLKTLGDPIHVDVRVPEQPNYCDCGIYLLHFFDRFFSDPDQFFHIILAAQRAPSHVSDMHEAWQQEAVEQKRGWWRDLILQLSAEWTQQHKDEASCIASTM